ncbi:MAG: peptide chain release factor N(5)-glutamine methyltransferase [Steroidobacteraceae bacterium]|nr:peptide chain release factor N(5)-glutamine methyltransferase [Steroidobacteraceae bacterium]
MSDRAPDCTIADVLAQARTAGVQGAAVAPLDAELLLAEALGASRAYLHAWPEHAVAPAAHARFLGLLARRAGGEPLAYVLGRREFWTLELEVGPGVLVPRPETELLVELALARLEQLRAPAVLDLGTGSGAIGLAIARERPDATVDLVDASAAALAVAERNRGHADCANARTLLGEWYAPVAGRRYAVVVSNPPYLAADDPHLADPALACEPRGALVAGPTGLEALRAVATDAGAHLEPGGWLIVEHGADQGSAVRELFAAAGLGSVATRRDLAGLERATLGRRPTG